MSVNSLRNSAIAACLAAAVIARFSIFMFDGDSAVFGLMAIHIGQLKEFPLYMWGAHYSGTLSSYLAALLFSVLGVSRTAGALPAILISFIWIFSLYAVARRILRPSGSLAALLLCLFPPVHVLRYSIFCGGVYPETFAFSAVLFLFAARRAAFRPARPGLFYFAAGAAAGFGQWLSPGMAPAAVTALVFFAAAEKEVFWRDCLPYFCAGFLAGYAPAIAYNIGHPGASLYRMGGRLLDLDRSFLNEPHKASVIAARIAAKILSGPANLLKLPAYYTQAAGPVNLALLAAGAALVLKESLARLKEKTFPAAADIALVYVFLFSVFYAFVLSAPDAYRYALPLYIAVPLILGRAFEFFYGRRPKLAAVMLAAIFCANLFTVFKEFRKIPPYDIDGLVSYLGRTGRQYAFSDYQTAYLVTFLTREATIVSPTLTHAEFFDRYPEYTRRARGAAESFFIINDTLTPGREEIALSRLKGLGVGFIRERVSGYTVISGLSRKVYPEELGPQMIRLPRAAGGT